MVLKRRLFRELFRFSNLNGFWYFKQTVSIGGVFYDEGVIVPEGRIKGFKEWEKTHPELITEEFDDYWLVKGTLDTAPDSEPEKSEPSKTLWDHLQNDKGAQPNGQD
jgi:hypothetical protein